MPILHIVRGLPGSGKTTATRKLAAETGAILIDPDALLVQGGEYRWSPERFESAKYFAGEMMASAARMDADIIYADVLPKRDEVYALLAWVRSARKFYDLKVYDLKITVEESKKRNIHNVRAEDIERMAREWEDWQ